MSVRRLLTVGYLLVLFAALGAAAMRPVAFQKANSIRVVGGPIPSIDGHDSFDVYGVLSRIPHRHDNQMVWDVEPDAKYHNTILEGKGNCSNLVFGLARHLQLEGLDFQIVHLMKPSMFLTGKGHTVLRTRFKLAGHEQVGLVDIFAGGVPRSGVRFLDVEDLRHGPVRDFAFSSWGGRPLHAQRFYSQLDKVEIGWIPAREVAEYFEFIRSVYVPFGSRRLEKYFYDGVALLVGKYPEIHVSDARPLASVNFLEWPFYVSALWVLRSAVVMLPLLACLEWRARRRPVTAG